MKNENASALGKLSAKARDTSSDAMRALARKRWATSTSMNGTITYVSEKKVNKRNEVYKLVTFLMEDGTRTRTYITPDMKNYPRWKDLLVEGMRVIGLRLKSPGLVDADSPVEALQDKK